MPGDPTAGADDGIWQQRCQVLLAASGSVLYDYDFARRCATFEGDTMALLGLAPERMPGDFGAYVARVHPDDRAAFVAAADAVAAAGTCFSHTYRLQRADGSHATIQDEGRVLRREPGRATRLVGLLKDVTEQRRAATALAEAQAQLKLAMHAGRTDALIWDIVRDEVRRLHGMPGIVGPSHDHPASFAEVLQKIHPDDRLQFEQRVRAAMAEPGTEYRNEFRAFAPDGSVRWLADTGRVDFDALGRPLRLLAIAADITERKQAELALQDSEERWRTLLGLLPVAVYTCDADGRITYVNARAVELWGRRPSPCDTEERFCGSFRLYHPDGRALPHAQSPAARALRSGATFRNQEVVIERADGSRITVMANIAPLRRDARVVGIVNCFDDITDFKRAEQALQTSEERLRLAGLATHDCVWDWDVAGDTVRWNERYAELFGRQAETGGAAWTWWIERIHPDERERTVSDLLNAIYGSAASWAAEYRFSKADGSWVDILDRAYIARDAQGRATRVVGAMSDQSERKRVERALADSERRFRAVFQHQFQFTGLLSPEGRILEISASALRNAGVDAASLVGQYFLEAPFFRGLPDAQALWRQQFDEALASRGEASRREAPFRDTDGELCWALNTVSTIRDEAGAVVYLLVEGIDITARRQAEDQLKEADRRKDEFLATLAHELRNPLAPLRNGLELIRLAGGRPALVDRTRAMMERQLTHLSRLVDDLMDLSRVSRGRIALVKTRLDLADAVRDAVEASRPLLEERSHELVLRLPAGATPVDGDRARLSQVFGNLLHNAAKYTAPGGLVQLTLERRPGEAVVSVQDNGIGIPSAMLTRVFEMFVQADRGPDDARVGLGIGLNLVQRLVHKHGGSVTAESAGHDLGSRFVVRLPLLEGTDASATPPGSEAAAATPEPAPALRVLVVDDNADGAASLAMMLEAMGHETRTAHDGEAALAEAETFRPALVLMDIGMPRLNGYEACRRIRLQPWGRGIVIVAQTGWGQEQDKHLAAQAGFDRHLVKPIDPAALDALLRAVQPGTAEPMA